MANKNKSQMEKVKRNLGECARIATYPEMASLMHGLLFAYQKVFINLYGNDARQLYPYIMEELSNILHTGDDPIIDTNKSIEENVDRCISFLSNEEVLKGLKFTKTDGNGYIFEVGECSFGSSGVHEILKMEGGICPFALVVATCLTELSPNEFVNINASNFDEKGSKTHLEMVAIEKDREEEGFKAPTKVEDELFPTLMFKTPIDELDLKILKELRKDGRKPNVEIAKALNSSESTVRRRIGLLLERGIIKGFTTLLHFDPKGTYTRAFVSLKVDPTNMDNLSEKLSNRTEACSVYKTIGKHNLICEFIFGDSAKLQEFIDELQYSKGVVELDYYLTSSAPKPCPWFGF